MKFFKKVFKLCDQQHTTDCYILSILYVNLMITTEQKCTTDTLKIKGKASATLWTVIYH